MRSGKTLTVDAVELVRSGRVLLSDITMSVNTNEHWVILGPNGAGKSTLLSLLGAQTHPTRGSVHVLGKRLGTFDLRELRTLIGHVDPRHRSDGPLTALGVVETGWTNTAHLLRRSGLTETQSERAAELLNMVGMRGRHDLLWSSMSQGERGRVLIARALVASPKLLLLDEPTTGLDVTGREDLLVLLDALRAEIDALSTVMVTHHFEEIPESTTHALLLREGRCVAAGPVDVVLTSETVSKCFGSQLRLAKTDGRWMARSRAYTTNVVL